MHGMLALLAMAFHTIVEELQASLEQAGYNDVRPSHGFVFHRLTPSGATGNELAEYLGITKQAISLMIDELEQRGYVERRAHPTDRRGKLIILTEKGWGCIKATEAAMVEIERHWAELLGAEQLESMRADLYRLVMMANHSQMPALRLVW
ncbi:MarR family transcriptional regulator [Ktedonosporobacter rubrisoli]|uniref:MarR family transcriptional regulator n=1 Tax=Ktedonosporobacter rubrisoli TaxID=2509675 RepID=A0A4P6K5R4_KTERU|nr:MarR family transcriptional regulator [Ktedonosporobacter rubrisoli]